MKPEDIRARLAQIDNAIYRRQYLEARSILQILDQEIYISEDDIQEMCPADLGDFGLEKEELEVNEE